MIKIKYTIKSPNGYLGEMFDTLNEAKEYHKEINDPVRPLEEKFYPNFVVKVQLEEIGIPEWERKRLLEIAEKFEMLHIVRGLVDLDNDSIHNGVAWEFERLWDEMTLERIENMQRVLIEDTKEWNKGFMIEVEEAIEAKKEGK